MAYEYRAVHIPAEADRQQTREVLAIHAEFGGWELTSHRIWSDGRREVKVRRRVSDDPLPPFAT